MFNVKLPVRPAPEIPKVQKKNGTLLDVHKKQKVPPPRPPPPKLQGAVRSQSAWNLNQVDALLEWSPPGSPKTNFTNEFPKPIGGSISSSFSSSTSSLASSKKSFEYETSHFNVNPWINQANSSRSAQVSPIVPQISVPTIIRSQPPKTSKIKESRTECSTIENSPPMPSIPPPSPPKESELIEVPVGVALYDFPGFQSGDLPLQVNDIVYLIRKVNNEWYYGRVDDKEGIFPANFIEVQVPLPEDEKNVTALYEFVPQTANDLHIKPGQIIQVIKKVSDDWLYGECDGKRGEFPANFVDRIPKL